MHSIPALHACDNMAGLPDCHAASQCSHIYYPKAMCPTVVFMQKIDMSMPICRCCCPGEDLRLFMLEGCCLLPWLGTPGLHSTQRLGLQNNS
jgi:hypothetical protein